MNFVIVIVDTLRYDHIGAHGNDWIQTPNLDRLVGESWDFSNSFCASYPTIPHRTDVITGRSGSPLFPWKPLRWDLPTLPWALADVGYATQLIHDTPHLVNGGHNFDWPFHAWTQVRGAEVDRPWIDTKDWWPENWTRDPMFDFVEREPQDLRLVPTYVRANRLRSRHEDWNCARLFQTAAAWLRDNDSRNGFLLWVDCFDPHEPWDVPPEFARLYDPDGDWDGRIDPRAFMVRDTEGAPEAAVQRVSAMYSAKASWVDRWLGDLLWALDDTGLADNTCLLLTSDHGTSLGERGYFGKRTPVQEQEGHTPFLVRLPGGERGKSDLMVQPQDVFPTIAALANVDVPEGVTGFDVLAQARGGAAEREVAVAGSAAGPHWAKPGQNLFTVFDGEWCLEYAAKPADCALTRIGSIEDVAADHPDVVERLRDAGLREIRRRGPDPRLMQWLSADGEGELDEGIVYWDGYPGPPGYTAYFQRIWEQW